MQRVLAMPYGDLHPCYVAKAERKGRTRAEVDAVVRWLTGYSQDQLEARLADGTDVATFLTEAPAPDPGREHVTGVVCGVRVEAIEDPLEREVRRLDKLVDELAKGRPMERVLRG